MPGGRRGHCVIAAPSSALASLDVAMQSARRSAKPRPASASPEDETALITDHELPSRESCFEACSSSLFCIALEFSPADASSSALADCRLVKEPLLVEAVAPSDAAACYVRRKVFLLPPPLPPPAQPPTSVLASVLAPVAVSMASGLLALATVGSACLLALRCRERGTGLGQRAAALASRGAAVGAEWGQRAAAAASSRFGKRGVQLLGVDRDAPLSPALPAAGQGSAAFHTLLAHAQQQAAAERFSRAEAAKPAAADVIGEILSRSRASGRHAAPSAGEAAADDDRRCRSPPIWGMEF